MYLNDESLCDIAISNAAIGYTGPKKYQEEVKDGLETKYVEMTINSAPSIFWALVSYQGVPLFYVLRNFGEEYIDWMADQIEPEAYNGNTYYSSNQEFFDWVWENYERDYPDGFFNWFFTGEKRGIYADKDSITLDEIVELENGKPFYVCKVAEIEA